MQVVALLPELEARRRLRTAFQDHADVTCCARRDELQELLASSCAELLIVDLWDADGLATAPVVSELRRNLPSLPVALYCQLTAQAAREILVLARAGAGAVLLRDVDDTPPMLRRLLREASSRRVAYESLAELRDLIPDHIAPMIEHLLVEASTATSVGSAASAFGINRKTLVNQFAAARLPPPSIMISWSRLLLATRLLEDAGRSVEQVAVAMGFGSGTALRNMLKRYVGLRPAAVRANGGMRHVLECLRRELASGSYAKVGSLPPE